MDALRPPPLAQMANTSHCPVTFEFLVRSFLTRNDVNVSTVVWPSFEPLFEKCLVQRFPMKSCEAWNCKSNQPINKSMNEPINQSINQRVTTRLLSTYAGPWLQYSNRCVLRLLLFCKGRVINTKFLHREQNLLRECVNTSNSRYWQRNRRIALVPNLDPAWTVLRYVGGADLSSPKNNQTEACAALVVIAVPSLKVKLFAWL
jgi:hypothetical protein